MIDTKLIQQPQLELQPRIIKKIIGLQQGPTIVFFGGIHGNEKAGVLALEKVLNPIKSKNVKGTIYGIAGNLKALQLNKRYVDSDLNRLWNKENIDFILNKKEQNEEEKQLVELHKILQTILIEEKAPFYFIDIHTTSSKTLPFITINDAMINRKFSALFPVPVVLGIEEYLEGPLLSYVNELGYVSIGFESGQHFEKNAITNAIAFIYMALVKTSIIDKQTIPDYSSYSQTLKIAAQNLSVIYEIADLHVIKPAEKFKMLKGYKSFQSIEKGDILALSNATEIKSKFNAKIFMPLYQSQGNEGFFIIKKIKPIYLKLSAILRKWNVDELLVMLPGITWHNKTKDSLSVNIKVTRFFAKSIFHLFGYRNRKLDKTHLRIYNREKVTKTKMYKTEKWYK